MEASTLRESLVYIAEQCPSSIGLKESRDESNILTSKCSKKCIDCWIKSLQLREDLLEE